MSIEILFILLLILLNGVFAMSEMAVVSSRQARLQQQVDQGSTSANMALALAESPNHFLSTVQVGITLVGTLAGAFSGSTIAHRIEPSLTDLPLVGEYSDAVSLGLVVIAITYATLVFGELAPKRIALSNPERIAMLIAYPMQLIATIFAPIVKFLSFSTSIVVRLLGIKPTNTAPITEEEIKILMEQGTEAGIFEPMEQDIVENVLQLDALEVNELITPRPELIWLDIDASLEENFEIMRNNTYSRYPVYQGEKQEVVGVISIKDVWREMSLKKSVDLAAIYKKPLFLPENISITTALSQMSENRHRLAIIIDEYNHTQGIITLSDILRAIVDEADNIVRPDEADEIIQRADGSWLVDAIITLEEFKAYFQIDLEALEEEEKAQYQTLGGFMLLRLGHIPKATDHFEWQNIYFEVVDMDRNRIDKILIKFPSDSNHATFADVHTE